MLSSDLKLAICLHLSAVMALYRRPKCIHFVLVINFLQRSAFWDIAHFLPIFRVFERTEVCVFVSKKLNKKGGQLFIFRDEVCVFISGGRDKILATVQLPTSAERNPIFTDNRQFLELRENFKCQKSCIYAQRYPV